MRAVIYKVSCNSRLASHEIIRMLYSLMSYILFHQGHMGKVTSARVSELPLCCIRFYTYAICFEKIDCSITTGHTISSFLGLQKAFHVVMIYVYVLHWERLWLGHTVRGTLEICKYNMKL